MPAAYLRGLGEMQTQHTCILLADIAETCNLRCPTCFADSSPDLPGLVGVADVLASVDTRLARENGRLDVLMLSGGEPTLHPELPRLLCELANRPIVRILINSNGVRIARDDALLDLLTDHRSKVEVYLQYDGSSAQASRHHRGADLRRIKADALRRLSQREIFTTLTMTAAAVRESLLGLLSEQTSLSHPSIGDLWRAVCDGCDLGLRTLLTAASAALPGRHRTLRRLLGERVVRITVKPFMDISTMLEERLLQCCVHVSTRGDAGRDQCAPFCAVQAWPALGAGRLPVAASTPTPGRALPLRPVVRAPRTQEVPGGGPSPGS